ncbi:MAG: hypothetical protein JWR18_2770 [Segetibacter sp.]|nr:hypothetical protein [Segetibacter sp.]
MSSTFNTYNKKNVVCFLLQCLLMQYNLHEHCFQLNNLITTLPTENTYKSISELNRILNKYLKILDYVNSYNEVYKSATRVYYSDITSIRDNFDQVLMANSHQKKEKAFTNATNELKADLHALALLIQRQEEIVS